MSTTLEQSIITRHQTQLNEPISDRDKNIWKIFSQLKKGNIIDLGCAGDKNKKFLESIGFNITIVDIDESKSDLRFDLNNEFPIDSSKYNYILAGEIIEHLYNYELFLKECHRILKPKGKLMLSTYNGFSYEIRLKTLFGIHHKWIPPKSGHVNVWNYNEFKSILEKYFKIIRTLMYQGHVESLKTWKYPIHVLIGRTIGRIPDLSRGWVFECNKK